MKKDEQKHIDFITGASGDRAFGKTERSAYTPDIRANIEKLYEDKFGLFVHWGPYAQLGGVWQGEEVAAEWIMNRAKIPVKVYEEQAAGLFTPERFNAKDWVDIAEQAGMKFIVVTAKHHDGFAMYGSKHPYNLVDFADFGRDVLKELAEECRQRGMKLGFYYSQSQDWHEEGAVGNIWDFPANARDAGFDPYFEEKVMPQLEELTTEYGDVFMVWFDTPVHMNDRHCEALMALIAKNQPGALVNSRLGNGYGHFDVSIDAGKRPNVCKADWLPDLKVPWQTHETVTKGGWGYTTYGSETDRSADYAELIGHVCNVVCYGGVFLLNVGPRPDGVIPPSQVSSLRAIGDWLTVNGESIYGADPSPLVFPPYAITSKPGKLYLHLREILNNQVSLQGILTGVTKAYCLADPAQTALDFSQDGAELAVTVPDAAIQLHVTVIVLELAAEQAQVADETLQQNADGSIELPAESCEFAVRRTSYDYDRKVTVRWGEHPLQGLLWTVNVSAPGEFCVISEDSGDERLEYELITRDDTLMLNALSGEVGVLSKKPQTGTIRIEQAGRQQIVVYPRVTARLNWSYNFKGLELVPVHEGGEVRRH